VQIATDFEAAQFYDVPDFHIARTESSGALLCHPLALRDTLAPRTVLMFAIQPWIASGANGKNPASQRLDVLNDGESFGRLSLDWLHHDLIVQGADLRCGANEL
jgi:hypothetical protein